MHTLPQLEYPYDALEPWIDKKTMEIHHTKHHQGYVEKLNAVLEKYPELADKKPEELMMNLHNLPLGHEDRKILKNNGGGHLNHTLFWQIMAPKKQVNQDLVGEITKEFGSVDEFKKIFNQIALNHFGSGWAWLVRDEQGKLKVYSLPNQDSPLLPPPDKKVGHTPIIGLDVWEHAYYLKYQNKRAEYVENWWNVLKFI